MEDSGCSSSLVSGGMGSLQVTVLDRMVGGGGKMYERPKLKHTCFLTTRGELPLPVHHAPYPGCPFGLIQRGTKIKAVKKSATCAASPRKSSKLAPSLRSVAQTAKIFVRSNSAPVEPPISSRPMVSVSSCFQCHRSHTFDRLGDHAPLDGRPAKSRGAPRDSASVHDPPSNRPWRK